MAQARWHLLGPDATWPLLAELAWIAPQRLTTLLPLLSDPALHKLARGFEGAGLDGPNDKTDWRWWPAAFKLVLALLRAESQGRHHDLMALRRQLQALQTVLFKAYMVTR